MSLSLRAAALAAMAFCTMMIGASAPGFATELDSTHNGLIVASVPANEAALDAQTGMVSAIFTPTPADTTSDPDYPTLDAAVAAEVSSDESDPDLTCLAGAIYFESKGEPLAGQLAVGEVILNRAKSGRFPKSICSVVTQPGQFSFVRGGEVPAVAECPAYRTALAVARVAIDKLWNSPATGAMFFHARSSSPSWRVTKIAAIGNHIFYR